MLAAAARKADHFHSRPRYPVSVRALMNFMHRDGWSLHILKEDCRTVLLGYRSVRDREMLLRIIAKLHGDVAKAEHDIRRWGRGSVWIDPSPEQCRSLGVRHLS